ncbi:EscE/YscE/SsaE family type III secretion system needle protein co-chaperone [Cupriavidus gilardii]|uniref:EscE/YscE/SsaE family type III secretion system needle protein co-chaperone n=1 Tax=Cupriavidus gilardii TaxID=82541 RepID=UPI0007E3CC3A|nr:EscE/YscE/SsaE family type III secretion system needle protein co-chaperone [Cupriavidus gilardii]
MEPDPTATPAVYGTSIEGRLAEDRDGALRKRLRADLARARRAIDAQLLEPQTPEAFARLTALREVCAAGTRTIDKIWRRLAEKQA